MRLFPPKPNICSNDNPSPPPITLVEKRATDTTLLPYSWNKVILFGGTLATKVIRCWHCFEWHIRPDACH